MSDYNFQVLEFRIQELEKENADLKRQLYASQRIRYQLDRRIQDEASKRTKANNALKFYADGLNYKMVVASSGVRSVAIQQDSGRTARGALYRK